jgi:Glycine rich protein
MSLMNKNFGFDPRKIPGCSLWLDGADPLGNGVIPSSGSSLATWADKSGNNYSATQATGGLQPTVSSSGILFNGSSQYMNVPSNAIPSGNSAWSYFFVVKPTLLGVTGFVRVWLGISSSADGLTNYNNFFIEINNRWNNNTGGQLTSSAVLNQSSLIEYIYTQGVNVSGFANGTQQNTASAGSLNVGNTYVFVGGNPNQSTWYFSGYISEILVYSTTLSSPQRQQVEGYLAQKWGIKQSLPLGHPGLRQLFYPTQKLPLAFPFISLNLPTPILPTAITNCLLWLDGADSSTMGLSGSTMTSWTDKSGGARNPTVYGTPTWVTGINGKNAVYLSNAPYFQGALTLSSSNYTCFSVASTTRALPNSSVDMRLVSFTSNTGTDFGQVGTCIGLFVQGSSTSIETYRVGSIGKKAITQNTGFLAVSEYDGTNGYLWADGLVDSPTGKPSSGNFSINRYTIGNRGDNSGELWQGYVGEVIVYSRALSVAERQSVESYLSTKWGTPYTIRVAGGQSAIAFPLRKPTIFQTARFTYTGTLQSFTVPLSINPPSITLYMWGAGGGGGYIQPASGYGQGTGGAGAMIQGVYTVTPGQTLYIVVGGGGCFAFPTNQTDAQGGGGSAYNDAPATNWGAGSGGGRSAIQLTPGGADVVVVGGGGGGGVSRGQTQGGSATFSGTANSGSASTGGTQSAGGSAGSGGQNGSLKFGGSGGSGAGGGGGYYGGGGGGSASGYGSGAGGSSYTGNLSLIPGQSVLGFNSTDGLSAPNTTNQYYQAGVGVGGPLTNSYSSSPSAMNFGGNGLVVFTYRA